MSTGKIVFVAIVAGMASAGLWYHVIGPKIQSAATPTA